ncbi:hypothetical protein ACO0K9_18935 [Undibacterium sp. Ji50W]|uniref:hypothetical protein n=1 Tax=Undibacterium sp. Ji50W TaxID=3413041 RepID=UPI003BF0AA53
MLIGILTHNMRADTLRFAPRRTKLNQYFENNLSNFMTTLADHAAAADFVPMDTRFLTPANQNFLTNAIKSLLQKFQSKVILIK